MLPDFSSFDFEQDLLESSESEEEPEPEVVEEVVEEEPEPPKEKTEFEKMQDMLNEMPKMDL